MENRKTIEKSNNNKKENAKTPDRLRKISCFFTFELVYTVTKTKQKRIRMD